MSERTRNESVYARHIGDEGDVACKCPWTNATGHRDMSLNATGHRDISLNATGHRDISLNATGHCPILNVTGNRDIKVAADDRPGCSDKNCSDRNCRSRDASVRLVVHLSVCVAKCAGLLDKSFSISHRPRTLYLNHC